MEKKLTPMMQLRDKLQGKLDIINANDSTDVFSKSGLITAIHLINTEMLPIEREMIEDVYLDGLDDDKDGITYYNETFKTEQSWTKEM